ASMDRYVCSLIFFFFSSRRRHTRSKRDWSSDVCSSDLWSHRWTQRVFTNTRLDFSRAATRLTPYFADIRNVSGEAGIQGNNQERSEERRVGKEWRAGRSAEQ